MRAPAAATLGALAVVQLTACAEPVGPRAREGLRADAPGFAVRTVSPSNAPRADRQAGALDTIGPGAVLFLEGWAPSASDALTVVSEQPAALVNSVRLVRRDAAAAVGSSDAALGFRVTVRTSSSRVCVLSQAPDGTVSVLAGSDPVWCPAP